MISGEAGAEYIAAYFATGSFFAPAAAVHMMCYGAAGRAAVGSGARFAHQHEIIVSTAALTMNVLGDGAIPAAGMAR